MIEIRLVKCGDCFFAANQFDDWDANERQFTITDDIMQAQIWRGEEDISPEDVAEFVGGRVISLKEVRDE